jgi:hypothetical protein
MSPMNRCGNLVQRLVPSSVREETAVLRVDNGRTPPPDQDTSPSFAARQQHDQPEWIDDEGAPGTDSGRHGDQGRPVSPASLAAATSFTIDGT